MPVMGRYEVFSRRKDRTAVVIDGGEFCLPPLAAASGGPCPGRALRDALDRGGRDGFFVQECPPGLNRGRWPLGKLIGSAYFCKTTIKNAMSAGVIPEIRAACPNVSGLTA